MPLYHLALIVSIILITPHAVAAAKNATLEPRRPMGWRRQEALAQKLMAVSMLTTFIGVVAAIHANDPWMIFGQPMICAIWFLVIYWILLKKYSAAPS